jgi:hypothetical protein
MDVLGTLDFKPPLISGNGLVDTTAHKHVLQVALAHVVPNRQQRGIGLQLYAALAHAGYVIISDNTQYLGGQALWKRIARETLGGRYQVFVLDNGVPRLDAAGQLVTYDGSNIDDAELWSEDRSRKYTLFALKAVHGEQTP